ncbi:MAG: DUF192 domain-containing protein [Spirochaetota bacterium]
MKKNSISILIVINSIFLVIAHTYYYNQQLSVYAQNKKNGVIYIINTINRKINCNVEIAATPEEHAKGLMGRSELCDNCGMLFIFDDEEYRTFWMKNTKIPLSIAFIDSNGIINDIQDMKPYQTFPTYSSKYPAKFALEVNQGWFQINYITIGAKVIINGCISK